MDSLFSFLFTFISAPLCCLRFRFASLLAGTFTCYLVLPSFSAMFRGSPSVLPSFYRVFPVDRIDLASFHRLALLWPYVYLVLPSFARLKNNDNNKNDTVYRRRYGASVDHFIIAERAVRGQASTFNDRQRRDAPAHRLGDVDSSSRRLFSFLFAFLLVEFIFFGGGRGIAFRFGR